MKIAVIKLGSSVLLTQRNKLDEFRIEHIADQIAVLRAKNFGVVLVVSGSVGCGADFINLSTKDSHRRRLAAGIGQAYVISVFHQIFTKKGLQVAQVLMTNKLHKSAASKAEIKKLLQDYMNLGVVPLVNENDVVELNGFGGNDYLAANLAVSLTAQQLLILSNMESSKHGVGGGEAKRQVLESFKQSKVRAKVVDGKSRNVILGSVL